MTLPGAARTNEALGLSEAREAGLDGGQILGPASASVRGVQVPRVERDAADGELSFQVRVLRMREAGATWNCLLGVGARDAGTIGHTRARCAAPRFWGGHDSPP